MAVFSILLFLCLCLFVNSQRGLDNVVNEISSNLLSLFNTATDYDVMNKYYAQLVNNTEVIEINVTNITHDIAASLIREVRPVFDVLRDSVNYATQLYISHLDTSCCSPECIDNYNKILCNRVCNASEITYYRASINEGVTPPLKYEPSFRRHVNLNDSSIHIPVNVNSEDPNVLCFIEWSQNLTDRFVQNWNQLIKTYNVRIGSQFIGSSSSSVRFFPSSEWTLLGDCDSCPYERVDTFNAKNRPWYINTVLGEKHAVILIDMSGSMTGSYSTLARLTATEFINGLSANDFFLVLRVGETNPSFKPFGNCFDKLVRASSENKLVITTILSEVDDPVGVADFEAAMTAAYNQLLNSSGCHKMIVIFSDGDATFPVESFSTLNSHKEIQVFTFQVSPEGDSSDMRKLACNNRGIFKTISGFDNVALSIQAIVDELQRPYNATDDIFNVRYIDLWTENLILTLSMPIKPYVGGTPQFVGAMGIDVTDIRSKNLIEGRRLGSLGYTFSINNNGQLISHPLISEQIHERVPGTLNVFDMMQLEFESQSDGGGVKFVRDAMVNRMTGEYTLMSHFPVENKKRYVTANTTYHYAPVINSIQSVSIKIPSEGVQLLDYIPLSESQLTQLLFNVTYNVIGEILISGQRSYCYNQFEYDLLNDIGARLFLEMLIEVALRHQNMSSTSCSPLLYEPLLNDLYYMYSSSLLSNVSANDTVISTFVQFTSGLLWCLGGGTETFNCTSLSTTNYVALAENNGIVLSVYRGISQSNTAIVAVRPLFLPLSPRVSIGVLGIISDVTTINQLLSNIPSNIYLLDEGGYIVGTTQNGEETNGTGFLGELQPALFLSLIENGIFINKSIKGYSTRSCTQGYGKERSSASRITGLLITFVTFLWHFMSWLTLVSLRSIFVLIPYSTSMSSSLSSSCQTLDLCQSQVIFYSANYSLIKETSHLNRSLDCSGQITYQVTIVPNTSLVLISIDEWSMLKSCPESDKVTIGEKDYQLPCQCSCTDCQLHRRRPSNSCPDTYTETQECSGVNRLQSITLSLCVFTLQPIITLFLS